jgi:rubrerythrin
VPTKAELQVAYADYLSMCDRASAAVVALDFAGAVSHADQSLSLLQRSLQFQRKFQKDSPILVPSIDLLVRFAAPLFAFAPIDRLTTWFGNLSRAEKQHCSFLQEKLELAQRQLQLASKIWANLLEADSKPVPFSNQNPIAQVWVQMGVVEQSSDRFRLTANYQKQVYGKCSTCGLLVRGMFTAFLEPRTCPACQQKRLFVIGKRVI